LILALKFVSPRNKLRFVIGPKPWTQRNGGEHAKKLRRDEGYDA
jgi:hypothetical protein